ncbi:MAG: hypothetical protein IKU86_13705 [Thermoguttaceae bacterium]|nr:hypothetical protein [Thermoguttaceae bacterium]
MNDNPTTVGQDTRVVTVAIVFRFFEKRRVGKNTPRVVKFAESGMAFGDKTRKKGDEQIAPVGTEVKRFASYVTLDRIATGALFRAVKVDYKMCVSLIFARLSSRKRGRRKNDANQNTQDRRWVNYTGRRFKRKPLSSKKAIFAKIRAFRKSRREQY